MTDANTWEVAATALLPPRRHAIPTTATAAAELSPRMRCRHHCRHRTIVAAAISPPPRYRRRSAVIPTATATLSQPLRNCRRGAIATTATAAAELSAFMRCCRYCRHHIIKPPKYCRCRANATAALCYVLEYFGTYFGYVLT